MTMQRRAESCPSRSALTSMLLDGSERHYRHLEECSACAEWMALAEATRTLLQEESASVFEPVCPPAEQWADAFDDPAGSDETLRRHLAECPDCAALWRFLHEMPTQTPGGYDRAAATIRARVAAAAILIGLAVVWASPSGRVTSGSGQLWRGRPAGTAGMGAGVLQDGDELRLSWEPVPGASVYVVQVWSLDGDVVMVEETGAREIRLDIDDMPPDGWAYWTVEARHEDAVVAESAPQILRWEQ